MENKLKYQIWAVVGVVITAVLGSVFVNLGMSWFNGLIKPSQWIPNFVIPIVWTIIYLLVAIYMVLLSKSSKFYKDNIVLFVANGILNVLWCFVFFTLHHTFLGVVVIVINAVLGYMLYLKQEKDNWLAKALLIYPIWLTIATLLNTAMWILN